MDLLKKILVIQYLKLQSCGDSMLCFCYVCDQEDSSDASVEAAKCVANLMCCISSSIDASMRNFLLR